MRYLNVRISEATPTNCSKVRDINNKSFCNCVMIADVIEGPKLPVLCALAVVDVKCVHIIPFADSTCHRNAAVHPSRE